MDRYLNLTISLILLSFNIINTPLAHFGLGLPITIMRGVIRKLEEDRHNSLADLQATVADRMRALARGSAGAP